MDTYSRYVVGWMIAHCESAALAERLIASTVEKQQISPGQLSVHADRGGAMTSKTVAFLLAVLGITKTHSRPYTSNGKPFSEAQFKTLKYRPDFPGRFRLIQDGRAFFQRFFDWYNREHRHSGIGLLTPEALHYNRADEIIARRHQVLAAAYAAHPKRFVRRPPSPSAAISWVHRANAARDQVFAGTLPPRAALEEAQRLMEVDYREYHDRRVR
jgi:putative transposase